MRLMGIDYGEKRIGVALSDEAGKFAFPYSIIENKGHRNVLARIYEICKEKNIGKIILGKSVDYKSAMNPIMKKIEIFKNLLEKETGLSVVYQTETLTTQEARRIIPDGGTRPPFSNKKKITRGRLKSSCKIDSSAAALILRSFIEKQDMV